MQMTLDPATERLFADLYRLHEARALRTAFALLGDRAAAEDAAQEAFVQAFRTLGRKREDVAFSTWLYRCLVWAARGQRRMRRGPELLLANPPGAPDDGELDRSELRLGLVAALTELPRRYREVLVLRYGLDLGEDETATVLGCRRGTVKSRAHRGLRLLAESGHLAGYDLGGHEHAASNA